MFGHRNVTIPNYSNFILYLTDIKDFSNLVSQFQSDT